MLSFHVDSFPRWKILFSISHLASSIRQKYSIRCFQEAILTFWSLQWGSLTGQMMKTDRSLLPPPTYSHSFLFLSLSFPHSFNSIVISHTRDHIHSFSLCPSVHLHRIVEYRVFPFPISSPGSTSSILLSCYPGRTFLYFYTAISRRKFDSFLFSSFFFFFKPVNLRKFYRLVDG